MLRGLPSDASVDEMRSRIVQGLQLDEHVEMHEGIYHAGFLSVEEATTLINRTIDVHLPTYCINLHCAIVYGEEVVEADACNAPSPRAHHFAVIWQARDDAQQEYRVRNSQ